MAHARHWQHDGGVGNSFSYLFGPIVAFLAIGVLVVVLRWAFNSRKTSVVAAAPKAGSQDEYTLDGPRVMVWPKDEQRARQTLIS